MLKLIASLGVLTVGGGLSICGLCGTGNTASAVAQQNHVASASLVPPAMTSRARFASEELTAAVKTQTVTFKIDGMTCGGCVIGVKKVLTRLPGVSRAFVTYEKSRAVVTYDPAKVTVAQMTAAIATLGYKATVATPTVTS